MTNVQCPMSEAQVLLNTWVLDIGHSSLDILSP
jgi:hypothetical protein